MKRRIFYGMCIVAFVSALLTLLPTVLVMSNKQFSAVKQELKNEVEYIGVLLENSGNDYSTLLSQLGTENRITLISDDGKVIFDNKANADLLENHANREEFLEAVASGFGEAVRTSESRGERTYYCARKLSDGSVIRVSNTTSGVLRIITDMTPAYIAASLASIGFAMLLAHYFTARIIKPINAFDPERPLESEIYDELSPLAGRIHRQNVQIEKSIAELKEKQHEMTQITDGMREGLIVLNGKRHIAFINRSASVILGVESSKAIGANILEVYRNTEIKSICESAFDGEHAETEETIKGRQYNFMASPLKRDNGIDGVIILIVDETEKILAEKQRREFSANVSHELKTPLTSISGYAELLKNGMVETEKIPEFAGRIHEEATKLVTLIGDIIRLSKLDEGGAGLEKKRTDILKIAKNVATRLVSAAEKRNISLNVSGERAFVYGVPQILDEVLFNLCDNAVKYNVVDGNVYINIDKTDDSVVVTIKDTGIGIPFDEQERVFERFYRVDKSHSKDIPGTGLGLSIVKHGVKFHKGTLELESETGKGTSFKLTFPRAKNED